MNPMEKQLVKCELCGRIREIFQYTKYEEKIVQTKIRGHDNPDGSPYFETITEDLGEKRGLCEECAVEINKREYDKKCVNHCGFAYPYGWVPEAGCEVHDLPASDINSTLNTERDPLFEAARTVAAQFRGKQFSTAILRQHLNIGYTKSALLIDQLEAAGIISAPNEKTHRRHVL